MLWGIVVEAKGPLFNASPVCGPLSHSIHPPWPPPIPRVTCKFDSRAPQNVGLLRKLLRRENRDGEMSAILAKRLASCRGSCRCQNGVSANSGWAARSRLDVGAPGLPSRTDRWACSAPPKTRRLKKAEIGAKVSYDGGLRIQGRRHQENRGDLFSLDQGSPTLATFKTRRRQLPGFLSKA